ncbi:MAG TPA: hypothetical protein VF765_16220 [Polyangiaceae bacterium]
MAHALLRRDNQEVAPLEPTDLTIEILKNIRDEVRLTRTDLSARIDATNVRLETLREDLSGRIDTLRDELSRRIVESEIRTATAVTDLAGAVSEMTGVLRASHDLRPRVERCELDIAELKKRVADR